MKRRVGARLAAAWIAAVAAGAALAGACVGDDPVATGTSGSDAGADGTSPSSGDTGAGGDASPGADASSEAADDAALAIDAADAAVDGPCTATMPFKTVASLGNSVNAGNYEEFDPRLSGDELTLYYASYAADDSSSVLKKSVRASVADPWPAGQNLFDPGGVYRFGVWPLAGQRWYGSQKDPTSPYGWTLVLVGYDDAGLAYGNYVSFAGWPSSGENYFSPAASLDENEIWFVGDHTQANAYEVYHAAGAVDAGFGFGTPARDDQLSSTANEISITVSQDGLTAFIGSDRGRTAKDYRIWMSTRPSRTAAWSAPVLAPGLDTVQFDTPKIARARPGWLSSDGCRLYLSSDKDGTTYDMFVASRR